MRAQEQGVEVGAKELAGLGRWPRRREGGRLSDLQPPHPPTLTPHPSVHSSGMCTCKGEPDPSLTPAHPGEAGSPSHLTPASPQFPLLVASFTGLVSPEGWGAIALCILEKNAGKGRGPHSPLAPGLCPSSALSSWLFLSRKGLQRGPHLQPPPASDSQAAFPAPKLSQHPHTLGVQLTQDPARTRRACAGACGGQAWVCCPMCLRPQDSSDTETLSRAPASLCPETNPPSRQPTLGFQSIVRVLSFGSFFGYFPLSGGRGGRAPHAGLGTCPFPDASRAPTPPAAYVYNVQSVPPSRKKELPRPVKMAGGAERGDGSIPPSKARIQIKKYIILIII